MAIEAVVGAFAAPRDAARAVRALRGVGFGVRVISSAPYPEVLSALERPRSRLGAASLSGAALGVGAGFALAAGTALDWPLVVGGKPVVSVPPFVVISFEVAILTGALSTLAGLVLLAWRGRTGRRFSAAVGGSWPIAVRADGGDPALAARTLLAYGAAEVRDDP